MSRRDETDEPRDPGTDEEPANEAAEPEGDADCGCDDSLEITIAPDGRVVLKHPTGELLDVAAALDPEDEELQRRLEAVREAASPPDDGDAGS